MILFSVEQSELGTRANHEATVEAVDILSKGPYKTAVGVYKGLAEVSILTSQVKVGRQLAKDFKQECYLERGHYGMWYLIETATDNVLDTFKNITEVSEEKALRSECYTIINGKYYLAKKY